MSFLHQHHSEMESDDLFESGTLAHLVIGNTGRVLDGRRTPGYIESYDAESAMFVWRITDFEDRGLCWEIPAEEINRYQFRKGSPKLSAAAMEEIAVRCRHFQQPLLISRNDASYERTQMLVREQELLANSWLETHSRFIQKKKKIDLTAQTGDTDLYLDLEDYLKQYRLYELEVKTANQYLLNPYSGEWLKGLKIVMAEMGLIDFEDTIPRTSGIFEGIGHKDLRKQYIIARMAFLRSLFKMTGLYEIPLFRGMSSLINLFETPCTLLSTTFSLQTAQAFASFDQSSLYKSAYLIKFSYPVENLFMTFLETRQFNERYQEQEAIVFYRDKLTF